MNLKPCPACGGEAEFSTITGSIRCLTSGCYLHGPREDPTGSKWDALPRRGDTEIAPQRMSDGELQARTALAVKAIEKSFEGSGWPWSAKNANIVFSELDRRANEREGGAT